MKHNTNTPCFYVMCALSVLYTFSSPVRADVEYDERAVTVLIFVVQLLCRPALIGDGNIRCINLLRLEERTQCCLFKFYTLKS